MRFFSKKYYPDLLKVNGNNEYSSFKKATFSFQEYIQTNLTENYIDNVKNN